MGAIRFIKSQKWDPNTNLPALDEIDVSIVSTDKDSKTQTAIKNDKGRITVTAETASIDEIKNRIIDLALTMSEFRLRGTVQDISDGIKLDVGKREDAYLDQGYKLFEQRLNDRNEIYSEYKGFVRISSVADNTNKMDALSTAYAIIGSPEPGFIIVSHDQFFDMLIRTYTKDFVIPKEFGRIYPNFYFEFDNDLNKTYNLEIATIYNLAKTLNIRQFFVGISLALGISPETSFVTDEAYLDNLTLGLPLIFEINLITQKKYWLGPAAIDFELQGGLRNFSISGTYNEKDLSFSVASFSVGGIVGLQFAISPDILFGLEGGYTHAFGFKSISLQYPGEDKSTSFTKEDLGEKWDFAKINSIDLSGLRFGINLSYSLSSFK